MQIFAFIFLLIKHMIRSGGLIKLDTSNDFNWISIREEKNKTCNYIMSTRALSCKKKLIISLYRV